VAACPLGCEMAKALGAPLDVFVVRKMGAIASGGVIVLNEDLIRALEIPCEVIRQVEAVGWQQVHPCFYPMLATLVARPFEEQAWIYEVKYDGSESLRIKKVRVKVHPEEEFVVTGSTAPAGSRICLLGVYSGDQLLYVEKVGTGFSRPTLRSLYQQFQPLIRKNAVASRPA